MRKHVLCLVLCACSSAPMEMTENDDPGTGTDVTSTDPMETPDPCVDLDTCADPSTDGNAPPPTTGWIAGAKAITLSYTTLRVSADATSAPVSGVDPDGGIKDSLHPYGNPSGVLTPAQTVVLVTGTKKNGFYQVTYDKKTGWIAASKLTLEDTTIDRVDFALAHPNAFFKNQFHRKLWNKDGPLHSGNCAPTSLAMAIAVLGKEPTGTSVEESIHRVRAVYDSGLHESNGTTRSQITAAAKALGVTTVVPMSTRLTPAAMLSRIDGYLAKKYVIALEGQPGDPAHSGSTTLYEKAFTAKYAAANISRIYDFDGGHSIFVLGKDKNGLYVVADPMSELGFVTLKAAELQDFFTRWGGTGNALR